MTTTRDILQADTLADLRAMPVDASAKVFLLGRASVGDSLGGLYYWDPAASAPEDTTYLSVVASDASPAGRWRRVVVRAVSYPQGVLVNTGGVKTLYASGVTTAAGECALNLTNDNTPTGSALFSEVWSNFSRAKTAAAGPADSVTSYTKSLAANLKSTTHGFFKPNPVTITLGLVYSPFAAAPAGVPVQFEVTGV